MTASTVETVTYRAPCPQCGGPAEWTGRAAAVGPTALSVACACAPGTADPADLAPEPAWLVAVRQQREAREARTVSVPAARAG